MPIKHLDEVSSEAFNDMKHAAETVIRSMLKQMDDRLCHACVCHLLAAAATEVAHEHEEAEYASIN